MNWRYRVDDELGPVRYYASKKEALRWVASRPDCRVVTLPKAKSQIDWDNFEAALF